MFAIRLVADAGRIRRRNRLQPTRPVCDIHDGLKKEVDLHGAKETSDCRFPKFDLNYFAEEPALH